MSLPSQSSRNATRSSQVHYRRSRSGPFRKLFTLALILGVIALIWYTLIRPRAAKITNEQTQSSAQPDADPIASSTPTNHIENTNSSRPLPGAGDLPNPDLNARLALGSSQSTKKPSSNTNRAHVNGASKDILSSAAQQANRKPETQTQTRTQTQREINNPTGIRLQLDAARRLVAQGDRVQARKLLSQTLLNADITFTQAQQLRDELTIINNQLLFSPVVDPKDPMSESYKIQPGDTLSHIAARRELATHWKLIARVNQIADPSKIRLGQNIKLVRGPFHAIVHKSAHRLDIFHGSPADPASWLFIRSFDVGLGSNDGTPVGEFVVSENKLENPGWVNPRNAQEQYAPNDPKNPIGEYWIGITGVGQSASLTSLGLHGTIDPSSIGSDRSMGCIRLADGDIDTVYELLAEHISRVIIRP